MLLTDDGTDEQVYTHGCVMAASSEVLRQKLLDVRSPLDELTYVRVENISSSVLTRLFDYVYGARLKVDREIVHPLLLAASQLRYLAVVKACYHFIDKTVDANTALGLLQLTREARRLTGDDPSSGKVTEDNIRRYVFQNVSRVLSSDDFKHYPTEEEILEYMCKAERETVTVESLLSAMLRWRTAGNGSRDLAFVRIMAVACKLWDGEALERDNNLCDDFMSS